MSFSVVDEIYKSYIGEDMNKDTEKANKYFDELFEIFNTLNLDLQNKISFLLADYSHKVEERSFKDGLKYGINLYKELQ